MSRDWWDAGMLRAVPGGVKLLRTTAGVTPYFGRTVLVPADENGALQIGTHYGDRVAARQKYAMAGVIVPILDTATHQDRPGSHHVEQRSGT